MIGGSESEVHFLLTYIMRRPFDDQEVDDASIRSGSIFKFRGLHQELRDNTEANFGATYARYDMQ